MGKNEYDAIYLSPHLDDAVLSCGGQIYERVSAGQRVLVVTITAGNPPLDTVSSYVQSLHDRWALASNAVAVRREEDVAAGSILGAEAVHWPAPDCIYRFDPNSKLPFYVSDVDIFGDVHPLEAGLVAEIETWMRRLPAHGVVFAPLAIGHHVDHLLTRQAAEACFGVNGLAYYEDYPYAQKPGALETVIPQDAPGWQPQVIALSPEALQAKFRAILAYRSQLSTFFVDYADLERQVGGYAAAVGGERVWRYSDTG
jgi:LmbE family N-acetylglucosaminyl deacetylase